MRNTALGFLTELGDCATAYRQFQHADNMTDAQAALTALAQIDCPEREKALAEFPHADQVEIVWRSFQLDPSAPDTPVETVADHLGRKYGGGPDAGRQMVERTSALAAEEGMTWRQSESLRVGTLDAHRLLHAAGELRGELKEALLNAYFAEAQNVADHETLTDPRIAARVAERAPHGRAVHYPADHFGIYHPPLVEAIVADQVAFLTQHLGIRGAVDA